MFRNTKLCFNCFTRNQITDKVREAAMDTKTDAKNQRGQIGEDQQQIIIISPDIVRQVVGSIPEIEDLDLAGEIYRRLVESALKNTPQVEPQAQKTEVTGYISEAYGHIKVFTPDFIQSIVDHIQTAEAAAPALDETLWSRKLAAKPFARELFDAATQKKQVDRCYSILNKTAELSEDRKAVAFLEDSEVHFLDKVELLNDRLGETDYLVMNLIYQLMTDGTLTMLADIAEEYNRLYNSLNGIVRAHVITAVFLDNEEKMKVSQRLEKMTGKQVILEAEIDPGIIGGIIIRIGDKLIDGSLRHKLEVMNKTMTGL